VQTFKKRFDLFRYSHSADIIDDTLWLLGGMNANERRPPGLCKINLITGEAIEYSIPVRKTVPSHSTSFLFAFLDNVW
jgi:hypothetical protein